MIKYIFLKELQIALLNRRLLISCLAIVILMVVSGVEFEKRHSIMQSEYEEFLLHEGQGIGLFTKNKQRELETYTQMGINISQEQVDEYMKIKLSDLIFTNRSISKEPSKLSFIASHNSSLPNGMEMNYFRMSTPQIYSFYNRYLNSFIALDWTNIIMYILSFICLCFAYDAFSGEKQNGTLKLMLASSVPRWKILLGKFFALWCILLTPVIIGIIIHFVIAQLSDVMTLLPTDYYKILAFTFIVALFIGINILLFFSISILTPHPSVSSIVCLLVWIVLVFVLPNTSWLIANKLHAIPSIAEQNYREESLIADADDRSIVWSNRWFLNWEQHAEDVYKWKDKHDRMENIHREIWDEYRNSLFRQTDIGIALSKVSPFMIFRFTCDRIADNNYYGYRNFQQQAIAYQDVYCKFIVDKDATDLESHHLIWNDRFKGCSNYISQAIINPNDVPVFKYQSPTVSYIIYNSRMDIVIMLLWLGVIFGIVFYFLIKYDVTN